MLHLVEELGVVEERLAVIHGDLVLAGAELLKSEAHRRSQLQTLLIVVYQVDEVSALVSGFHLLGLGFLRI